jgi:hypothetical protein
MRNRNKRKQAGRDNVNPAFDILSITLSGGGVAKVTVKGPLGTLLSGTTNIVISGTSVDGYNVATDGKVIATGVRDSFTINSITTPYTSDSVGGAWRLA